MSAELRGQIPVLPDFGEQCFRLASIALGASLSFLPATYVLLISHVKEFGLTIWTMTLLWCLLALVLIWEFWKSAVWSWKHSMVFEPKVLLFLYLVCVSFYIFLLVVMPASVVVPAQLKLEQKGTPNITAFAAIVPLAGIFFLLQLSSLCATLLKLGIADERDRIKEDVIYAIVSMALLSLWAAVWWGVQVHTISAHHALAEILSLGAVYSIDILIVSMGKRGTPSPLSRTVITGPPGAAA